MKWFFLVVFSFSTYSQTITFEDKHHKYLNGSELQYFLESKFSLSASDFPILNIIKKQNGGSYSNCYLSTGEADLKSGKMSIKKPNGSFVSEYLVCVSSLISGRIGLFMNFDNLYYDEEGFYDGNIIYDEYGNPIVDDTTEKFTKAQVSMEEFNLLLEKFGIDLLTEFLDESFPADEISNLFLDPSIYKNILNPDSEDYDLEYTAGLAASFLQSDFSNYKKSSLIELIENLHIEFVGPDIILEKLNFYGENSFYGKDLTDKKQYLAFIYDKAISMKESQSDEMTLEKFYENVLTIIFLNEYLIRE